MIPAIWIHKHCFGYCWNKILISISFIWITIFIIYYFDNLITWYFTFYKITKIYSRACSYVRHQLLLLVSFACWYYIYKTYTLRASIITFTIHAWMFNIHVFMLLAIICMPQKFNFVTAQFHIYFSAFVLFPMCFIWSVLHVLQIILTAVKQRSKNVCVCLRWTRITAVFSSQ